MANGRWAIVGVKALATCILDLSGVNGSPDDIHLSASRSIGANLVLNLSYALALRVVRLYRYLSETRQEWGLSKPLLDPGDNLGASANAAQEAESKQDFFHEMNLALRMASKTGFWLQLPLDGE